MYKSARNLYFLYLVFNWNYVNDVSYKKIIQLPTPVYFQATTVTEVRNLSRYFWTGYGGGGGGIEQAGLMNDHFKPGIDFSSPAVSCLAYCLHGENVFINRVLTSSTHSIWRWLFWSLQFLHFASMPPRINSTTELISHKESFPWNRCLSPNL